MQAKHYTIGEVPYLAEHLKGSEEQTGTETTSSDPGLTGLCLLAFPLPEGPPGCSQVLCAPSLKGSLEILAVYFVFI